MRGWVYQISDRRWMAVIADGTPDDAARIHHDLGDYETHAEAIEAVCDALGGVA